MTNNAARGAWLCALAILAVIGLAMALARPASAQAQAQRFSMKVVGEGPDVILIPGLSMPRETWDETVEGLSGEYRFHLLQVRGFGEPAGINAEPGPILDPLVDELAAYIEAEALEDPAVVGHSMGGLIAMMLGVEHPEAAGSLLIVDALPWVGVMFGGIAADTEMMEPNFARMRDTLLAASAQPISDAAVAAETRGIADEANRQLVGDWMRQADLRVTAQTFYDDATTDLRQDIARIEVPMTVLVPWREGQPGEGPTLAMYRMQYEAAAQAELIGIGNSGHFIMLDQPEAFLTALDDFLSR